VVGAGIFRRRSNSNGLLARCLGVVGTESNGATCRHTDDYVLVNDVDVGVTTSVAVHETQQGACLPRYTGTQAGS
jgi:hypothetical protein